ncbi:FAD-binding protein [Deltaproteobacteria bacterium OttesenSCG-928-K17]|nr:FAD-binding protein [Deltaproteobacteria bacterium OttesenSCG-928-K17]
MYDIAIIGLGPAGATLARCLDPGLKIAAIDRKRLDGSDLGYRKPCGGLLAPSAQKALVQAGLNLPSSVLVDPQIFAVKTMDLPSGRIRHYQRCFLNMDRHKFDLWLCSLIPSSVKVFDGSNCRSIERNSDGAYDLTLTQGGHQWTISAKVVVGADGSASLARRLVAPKVDVRRYICIQENFPGLGKETYGCFFDERITDCYGWINNKNGILTLGAALPLRKSHTTPGQKFETLKHSLSDFGYRFYGAPLLKEACLVSRPSSLGQINAGHNNIFLIGEAAGLVSPSSLEGISYALKSGRALSRAINGGLAAGDLGSCRRQYNQALRPMKAKIALRLLKSPFMYQPLLRRLVMTSGIKSVDINHQPGDYC